MTDKVKALVAAGFSKEQAEILAGMAPAKKAPAKKTTTKKTTKPDPIPGSYITLKGETIQVEIGQVAANGRRWLRLPSGKWFQAEEGRVSTAPFTVSPAPTTAAAAIDTTPTTTTRGPGRPRKVWAIEPTTTTISDKDRLRLGDIRRDLTVTKTLTLTAAKAALRAINANPVIAEMWAVKAHLAAK